MRCSVIDRRGFVSAEDADCVRALGTVSSSAVPSHVARAPSHAAVTNEAFANNSTVAIDVSRSVGEQAADSDKVSNTVDQCILCTHLLALDGVC